MANTYHSQNDASHLSQPTEAEAAPVDPKETGSRGKPPGQPEAGVQKPGPGGTLAGEQPDKKDPYEEEYDEPDGSLDAFD
ncbi:hypothetical protein D9O50_03040 [Oxalobacteraceae bacterium CAVE-383]|nr:hypothetical protein D9O50_03040 [Oxalobacteraceae bacterium CAVE-383]